ncbi:MAG: trigger factor [Planctomycetota bacterium]|jgi:trigger factor
MGEEQETTTLKNIVTIREIGPCKKKVVIEIPEETVKKATDEQYDRLQKEAAVPGFRKGRAPRRLLEKRFGKETKEQIKLKLLADAGDTAIKDNEIKVLRDPDIKYEKVELPDSGTLTFDFEVEVRPEFKLPKLEGIEVTKPKLEVSNKQIDREIEQLQKYAGVWAPRDNDSEVELDDQIIANVILKAEGIEEEEKLDNIEIFVRKGGFVGAVPVEKLDKLLIGSRAGDTKKTTVDVPKTYFREEYRAKKVDIQIDIKDIKWLKAAELDKNFLDRLGAEDEKDLREKMRDTLQTRLEQQSRTEMTEQIYKRLLAKTDFDLPLDIVADQANMLLKRQFTNLIQQGLRQEQLTEEMEKLRAGSEEQAREQLKTFFIMDKVAEELKIEVSEEEVNGQIAQLAIQRGQRPERLREEMVRNGTLAQFRLKVREDKCIAKLLESAKIKEVAPKKEAKKVSKKTTSKTTKKTVKKAASAKKK